MKIQTRQNRNGVHVTDNQFFVDEQMYLFSLIQGKCKGCFHTLMRAILESLPLTFSSVWA
jgi:hypothetical protein